MRKKRDHGSYGRDVRPNNECEGLDAQGRVRSEFGRKCSASARTERINLGLTLLQLVAQPGVPLSLNDIAAWCDCSSSAIQIIEEKALKKLSMRFRFMRETDPRLAEIAEQVFYAREPAVRKEAA